MTDIRAIVSWGVQGAIAPIAGPKTTAKSGPNELKLSVAPSPTTTKRPEPTES